MKANKSNKFSKNPFLRAVSYILAAVVIVATAYFGSQNKAVETDGIPIMMAISDNNYSVSVDQLSELYIVAELVRDR